MTINSTLGPNGYEVSIPAPVSWGGIVADGVALYDVSTTNSATCTVNSATGNFSSADVGKVCALVPYTDTQLIAGTSGADGVITSVASPTQAVCALRIAPGTLTNAIFVYGTDNKETLDGLFSDLVARPERGLLTLPAGIICSTGYHTIPSGVTFRGSGNNTTGGPAKNFKHMGTSLVCCKYSAAAGYFIATGSFGLGDPRGAAIEHMNIDSMCMTARCVDGAVSGRTERLFAVTVVRSAYGSTLQLGPTGRAALCHVLHNNVSDGVSVSGDGKLLDCIVVGSAANRARIAVSNPTDVLVSRCHVWVSNGTTLPGHGIRVSFNTGNTIAGCATLVDNEIDSTFGNAYHVAASGSSKGRAVSISGGHVFNNDQVPNNTGSVLGISVEAGSTIKGLSFRNVVGMAAFNNPAVGQWANLIDGSAVAGTLAGLTTGGCNVSGCNAMYVGVTPTVDDRNVIFTGVSDTPTLSTRI